MAQAQPCHLRTRASSAGASLRGRNQGRTAGHRARPVRSPSHESKHCRRTATWSQPGRAAGHVAGAVRPPSHESKHCRRIATWSQPGRATGHVAGAVRSPSHASKHCRRIATCRQAGARRLKWRRHSQAHHRTRASTAGALLRGRNQGRTAGHGAGAVMPPSHASKHSGASLRGGKQGRTAGIAHAQLGHLRTRASTAGASLRGGKQGRVAGHRARPVRSPSHESKHCRRIATWRQAGARRLKWRRRSHATFA